MCSSDLFASLTTRPDTERVSIGWAVPHSSHRPGLAREGNRCRERAFVIDGGGWIQITCHCGATPFEIADDLGIGRDILQSHAPEQHLMLTLQRRLRDDLNDPVVRELLIAKGISVNQALRWKMSDAGRPPELWSHESEVIRAA